MKKYIYSGYMYNQNHNYDVGKVYEVIAKNPRDYICIIENLKNIDLVSTDADGIKSIFNDNIRIFEIEILPGCDIVTINNCKYINKFKVLKELNKNEILMQIFPKYIFDQNNLILNIKGSEAVYYKYINDLLIFKQHIAIKGIIKSSMYEYDDSNNLIKIESLNGDILEHRYNDNNDIILSKYNGKLERTYSYEFKDGLKIKTIINHSCGEFRVVFKYNNDNKLINKIISDNDIIVNYDYDNKGRKIYEEHTNNILNVRFIYKMEYDDQGNMVLFNHKNYSDGNLVSRTCIKINKDNIKHFQEDKLISEIKIS